MFIAGEEIRAVQDALQGGNTESFEIDAVPYLPGQGYQVLVFTEDGYAPPGQDLLRRLTAYARDGHDVAIWKEFRAEEVPMSPPMYFEIPRLTGFDSFGNVEQAQLGFNVIDRDPSIFHWVSLARFLSHEESSAFFPELIRAGLLTTRAGDADFGVNPSTNVVTLHRLIEPIIRGTEAWPDGLFYLDAVIVDGGLKFVFPSDEEPIIGESVRVYFGSFLPNPTKDNFDLNILQDNLAGESKVIRVSGSQEGRELVQQSLRNSGIRIMEDNDMIRCFWERRRVGVVEMFYNPSDSEVEIEVEVSFESTAYIDLTRRGYKIYFWLPDGVDEDGSAYYEEGADPLRPVEIGGGLILEEAVREFGDNMDIERILLAEVRGQNHLRSADFANLSRNEELRSALREGVSMEMRRGEGAIEYWQRVGREARTVVERLERQENIEAREAQILIARADRLEREAELLERRDIARRRVGR